MTDSSLVTYTNLTKKYSTKTEKNRKITIHHSVSVQTAKQIADFFANSKKFASANYCIGNDGSIALSVHEWNRAITSSNRWNDNQAVTIEVSNCSLKGDYPISDRAYNALIDLCVDICKRNDIQSVYYDGTKNGVLTEHRMFAATQCPGEYIHNLLKSGKIASDINARLNTGIVYGQGYVVDGLDYGVVFNPDYYIRRYPDLSNAGLKSNQQLFTHFIQLGMMEARQANATFDVVRYRKQNYDLELAFDDDWEMYYKHYIICGRDEIIEGKRKAI